MSLIDALKTTPEPKHLVAGILEKVSGPEQQALNDALRSPDWTHERLAAVLTEQGYPVSSSSVRRYRRALR